MYGFASWNDTAKRLREAVETVWEDRRFYSTRWLLVGAELALKNVGGCAEQFPAALGLTELETQVLAYLTNQQNTIVSAQELFQEIWRQDSAGDIANTVNCCLKRLRKKLGRSPQFAYEIQTIRGRGYRLIKKTGD